MFVEYSSRFSIKCPFTEEGLRRFSELCRRYGLGLDDLTSNDVGRRALERAVNVVLEILERRRIEDVQDVDPDLELLSNYIAIFIIAALDRRAWRRFADALSKRCCELLGIRDGVNPDLIVRAALSLGIDVKPVRDVIDDPLLTYAFDVVIPLWQYLGLMPKFDPNWKPYSKYVLRGYVFLTYRDLTRIIEEALERRILNMIERASNTSEAMRQILESMGVMGLLEAKLSSLRPVEGVVRIDGQGVIPPCMQAIMDEIRSGGNPSHHARFAVTAYLLHKCHELEGRPIEDCVEEVVGLFKSVADFDEKKTRYQVEHIAGLRGGRKFYMPPNCDELNSLGLCPTNLGCGVKNPLVYTAIRLRKSGGNGGSKGE